MQEAPLRLVADIGRVSVRFGLTGGAGGMAPRDVRAFHTADYPTFTNALLAYLDGTGLRDTPLPSVLAVAGSARGDLINLTGSRWYISLSGVEAVLRSRPRAINECAATALAITTLGAGNLIALPGPAPRLPQPTGNYLVVSIGTGLGVAALLGDGTRLAPVQSEAGHMSFMPADAAAQRFAAARSGPLDFEAVLSSGGLSAAYAAFGGAPGTSPEGVTRATSRDVAAVQAMDFFVETLGGFIGDLAMAFGAWDGVFLVGAIARSCHARLADPRLRRRLEAKSAFRRQLADLPLAVVNRPDLELVGAAAFAGQG